MRRFRYSLATAALTAALAVVINLTTAPIHLPSWVYTAMWIPGALLVFAAALVEWRRGSEESQLSAAEQLTAATDVLAQATLSLWSRQSAAWGIETTADPVRVTWHWDHQRSLPIHEVLGRPGGKARRVPRRRSADRRNQVEDSRGEQGVVSDLHADLWRRIQRQQLLLLGPAGSGKTAAMLMLLIRAAEVCVKPILTGGHAGTPVPVWVTLGGWNPGEKPLLDHVVREMETNFRALRHPRYGADAARRLIEKGQVALFLDGLDEMPAAGQRAALTAIAKEAAGLRVVLTSQIEGYDRARTGGRLPRPVALQLERVDPDTAAEYLRRGHDSDRQRRLWRRLTDHLRSHPRSPVAEAFATPLILSLARDAFGGPDGGASDPTELLALSSVAEVKARVIGQFLQRAYPSDSGPRGRLRNQRHLFYLSWLAHHLQGRRDLRWWEIPTWVPGGLLQIVVALGIGLPTALLAGICAALANGSEAAPMWAVLGASLGLAGFAVAWVVQPTPPGTNPTPVEPIGMDLRWPTRAELRTLWLFGSGPPLTIGVATGILFGPLAGVLLGMALLGLVIVGTSISRANVTFGLLGIWLKPMADSPASTPSRVFRADRRRSLVTVISGVVLGGVLFALFRIVDSARSGVTPVGPEFGVLIGMTYGIISGLGPAVLTGVAPIVLLLRGRPPVRFPVLFQEALRRQVLRQAGVVYQFRHAELQDHLAAAHQRRQDPGPTRRPHTVRPVAPGLAGPRRRPSGYPPVR